MHHVLSAADADWPGLVRPVRQVAASGAKSAASDNCTDSPATCLAGPCLWNSLPVTLRDRAISLVQFKRDF